LSVLSILRVLDFGEVDICTSCRINPAGQSVARRRTTPGERPSITREETWRSLPRDFLHDQKQIWLFPTQLAKGKHWVPTVAIVGVTAGLVISDPHTMPNFRSHQRNWGDFNGVFNSYLATGEVGTPVC